MTFPYPDLPPTYPAGTLDIEAVKLGIYEWVKTATRGIIPDTSIIWRNQSEPLPARPCVTLKIISGPSPVGRNANLFFNPKTGQHPPTANQDQKFTYGMQMEMTLSVQVFGNPQKSTPGAFQLTLDLNSSLLRQSILDKLKQSGVSIQGKSEVRNLTALEETKYEERAGFDISMGLAQNIADEPGTIETVDMVLPPNRDVTVDLT